MKTYIVNFHTKNEDGEWLLGKAEESYKFVTNKPLIDVRADVIALREAMKFDYPKGLIFVVQIYN